MKKMKPNTEKELHYRADGKPYFLYVNTLTGNYRARWWTNARVPGTVRTSRMPGGSSFRNNWEG